MPIKPEMRYSQDIAPVVSSGLQNQQQLQHLVDTKFYFKTILQTWTRISRIHYFVNVC